MNTRKKTSHLLGIVVVFILTAMSVSITPVYASTDYDMATTSNWNIRLDGAQAGANLGGYWLESSEYADVNNNGIHDLIVQDSSYVYVIYDDILSALSGTGQTLDLNSPSSYSVRFSNAGPNEGVLVRDFNNDSLPDIAIARSGADFNSRADSGSLYIFFNSLFGEVSGTGNTIDASSTFSVRIDGPAANEYLTIVGITAGDIIGNDGKQDLIIDHAYASNNSRAYSGSVYILSNSLFGDLTGTGNTIDLATSSNWSIRIDGAVANHLLGGYGGLGIGVADLDNDSKDDFIVGTPDAGYNSRSYSGSLWILYNTLLDDYTGTGNTIDLATTSNWNIRIDGPVASGYLQTSNGPIFSDADDDDKTDLFIGVSNADYNSRANSGSLYILLQSLLDDYTGTGNTIDLASSSNYNMRIDGPAAGSAFPKQFSVADFNNDEKADLVAGYDASNNSRTNSGSVVQLDNSLLYTSGTGNTIDLASSYTFRYDGPAANGLLGFPGVRFVDANGDGLIDLLFGASYQDYNSRANSGSIYIVYNFPHTITSSTTERTRITGTVTSPNSTTNISGVQYQINSNNPLSGWSECTATDGAFDSLSEAYVCTMPSAPASVGTHTVYIRAYDTNTSYTAQSNYLTHIHTQTAPVSTMPSSSPSQPQIEQSPDGPDTGGVATATGDSSTGGQTVLAIIEPGTFPFNAFLSSIETSGSSLNSLSFLGNTVLAGDMLGIKVCSQVAWQVGNIQNIWYKAYAPGTKTDNAARIIPELQSKPSIISLSYTDADLSPPGNPLTRFSPHSLKLAHSLDGITWTILPTSVVDTTNHTVAALHKVGGYYMIVSGVYCNKAATTPMGYKLPNTGFLNPLQDVFEKPLTTPSQPSTSKKSSSTTPEAPSLWERILDYFQKVIR